MRLWEVLAFLCGWTLVSVVSLSPGFAAAAEETEVPASSYTLRIAADEPMASRLEECLGQGLGQRPGLRRDDAQFRYFLSLVAMPIVQDKNGQVLGYSISTLVLSPLETTDIISHMVAGSREEVAPLLARAHNVLDWKLYIIKPQNLPVQCERMVLDMTQAIASEEARQKSLASPGKP